MVIDHMHNRFSSTRHVRRIHLAFLAMHILVPTVLILSLLAGATVYAQDTFVVMSPEYSSCGNVSINGVVIITPPAMGLVWDWGDGSKTTSWFPATHRYTTNGDFTVTVTAAACNSLIETQNVSVINAGASGCPPPASATFYHLVPYNMHLTAGAPGAALDVIDQDGNPVSGTLTFSVNNPPDPLVSVSPSGIVTALRTEKTENPGAEIGVWVTATLNGVEVSNTCVVRVLPTDYSTVPFAEVSGLRTTLYYPTTVNEVDIAALVDQFEVPAVNEYAYQIESRLMATSPFNGGRQIFEVDFGVTGPNSPCGISGNPLRLGWNIEDSSEWANCFMVPFAPFSVPNPQWFVLYHELGHNITWASFIFGTAMNHFLYSEGLASAIALAAMEEIVADPVKYPLGADATSSLLTRYDNHVNSYLQARLNWIAGGADFASLISQQGNGPDILDGIWFYHKTGVPHFADRFFLPLQPLMIEYLGEILCSVQTEGDVGKHTFFAALMSAAAGTDLYNTFFDDYNYPLNQELYDSAHAAFTGIIAQRECPGDFDKDGSSDVEDLALFTADFGKTGCSGGSCNGDFNTDGDVDGSELSAFILKFGRTDCL